MTEIAVIRVSGGSLVLTEVAPGMTPAEVQRRTGARLTVESSLLG